MGLGGRPAGAAGLKGQGKPAARPATPSSAVLTSSSAANSPLGTAESLVALVVVVVWLPAVLLLWRRKRWPRGRLIRRLRRPE
jgi:hypothetical protein